MPRGNHISKQTIHEMKLARENGDNPKEIAKRFGVRLKSVYEHTGNWVKRTIKEKEPVRSDIFDYSIHGYPYFREPREKKK